MAKKDYTLSDGTLLTKGSMIAANLVSTHLDATNYSEPEKFQPYRYYDMRMQNQSESAKTRFASTSASYLAFGHGKHACPGRFFAVNEMKAVMCHLVLNYDLRAEVEGVKPDNLLQGMTVVPNPFAKVLLKRRPFGEN